MTANIFKEWFFPKHSKVFLSNFKLVQYQNNLFQITTFLKEQNLPLNGLIILDNTSEETLSTEYGSIFTIFMPPNVTSLIQPMDQNVIRLTKLHYKNVINRSNESIHHTLHTLTINMPYYIYPLPGKKFLLK